MGTHAPAKRRRHHIYSDYLMLLRKFSETAIYYSRCITALSGSIEAIVPPDPKQSQTTRGNDGRGNAKTEEGGGAESDEGQHAASLFATRCLANELGYCRESGGLRMMKKLEPGEKKWMWGSSGTRPKEEWDQNHLSSASTSARPLNNWLSEMIDN